MAPEDQPPPALSSRSSSTDDFCYVFLVELERGPSGLGMGLIDGMVGGPWVPVNHRWATAPGVVTGEEGPGAWPGHFCGV